MKDWRRVRLRRICDINPATPEFANVWADEPVTFLPLEAVWPDSLDTSIERPKRELESGHTRFREGDLLVPKITPTFEASRSSMALGLRNGLGCGTTELHVLRPDPNLVYGRFLFYETHSCRFLSEGTGSMQGVAGQKRVPESMVAQFLIDLPSTDEQRRIADFLDRETGRIDRLIAARTRLLRLLDDRRRRVITRAVTRGFTLTATRTGTFRAVKPDLGWNLIRLKNLVETPLAGTWGQDAGNGDDETVPCVRAADFDRRQHTALPDRAPRRVVAHADVERLRLRRGDLLVEKSGGGDTQPVGFVVRYDSDAEAVCSNFVARLRPTVGLSEDYVALVFIAAYELGINIPFIKRTTGIQNLDLPAFLGTWWAIPDLVVQASVSEVVSRSLQQMDRLRSAIEAQVELLLARRQTLISAAVTGQIEVQDVKSAAN